MWNCRICDEPATHIFRCDEHYACEDCGTLEKLCFHSEGLLCDPCHTRRVEKRIAEFKGDTSYTDEVTCPQCGYVHSDSWEWSEGERQCQDCGRAFEMTRNVSVSYSTVKL